jgi:hypothetical protein
LAGVDAQCGGVHGDAVSVPLEKRFITRCTAFSRAIDRAVGDRVDDPMLRSTLGVRMDRHAATGRLKHLAAT